MTGLLVSFILAVFLIDFQVESSEVCYGDLGCFSNTGSFRHLMIRPVSLLPQSPAEIATAFLLFTRQNPTTFTNITLENMDSTIKASKFNPSNPTIFIVHGYVDNFIVGKWIFGMKDDLLSVKNANVFVVDWSKTNHFLYSTATANTRVVGAQIAKFIQKLKIRPESVHIIGHSLGSHIAGYAGERVKGIARISGIDPAGPYFANMPTEVRLDAGDATFVDVIHTDAVPLTGCGTSQAMGHLDFYPNSGSFQLGCITSPYTTLFKSGLTDSARMLFACNHLRSIDYFRESIRSKSCDMIGFQCKSWDDFRRGNCTDCSDGSCAKMGYRADEYKNRVGKDAQGFYLLTNYADPFCVYHFRVALQFAKESSAVAGSVVLSVNGKSLSSSPSLNIKPASELSFVATSTEPLEQLTYQNALVTLQWSGNNTVGIKVNSLTFKTMNAESTPIETKFCKTATLFTKCKA